VSIATRDAYKGIVWHCTGGLEALIGELGLESLAEWLGTVDDESLDRGFKTLSVWAMEFRLEQKRREGAA
jgi:hypothetical protein